MKKNIFNLAILATFVLALASCKKDPVAPTPTPTPTDTTSTKKAGTVLIEFENKVGSLGLKMDGTVYKNQNGDDFTVTKFNYYISNIKLNGNDGNTAFTESESYHLLEQSNAASLDFSLAKVPAGTYKSITFTIGVDSLRNVSGAQTGALDPANGMFWSWSSGYIMLKMEGTSPQSPQAGNILRIHVGGFSGVNNAVKTVTINFPNTITVNGDENHVHLSADVAKLFGPSNVTSFASTSVIHMPGAAAKNIADNYASMFSVTEAGK
jgi:hypothetical protein